MCNKSVLYEEDVKEIIAYYKLSKVLNKKLDNNKLEKFHVAVDEHGFNFLEGNLQNGYTVEIMFDGGKGIKYNIDLLYNGENVRNTRYLKSIKDLIKQIKDIELETLIWAENGKNNEEDMRKELDNENRSIRDAMELHNMLADAICKVGNYNLQKELAKKGIDKDKYFYKDRAFYNKETMKPVYVCQTF